MAVNVGAEGLVSWARNDSASETMSNTLLSAAGTAVGFKAGDFGKAQADKIWSSYSASMKSKPTGFLTIEGPYSRSIVPSSIGSGIGSITGEKIAAYNQDVTLFLGQFGVKRAGK